MLDGSQRIYCHPACAQYVSSYHLVGHYRVAVNISCSWPTKSLSFIFFSFGGHTGRDVVCIPPNRKRKPLRGKDSVTLRGWIIIHLDRPIITKEKKKLLIGLSYEWLFHEVIRRTHSLPAPVQKFKRWRTVNVGGGVTFLSLSFTHGPGN